MSSLLDKIRESVKRGKGENFFYRDEACEDMFYGDEIDAKIDAEILAMNNLEILQLIEDVLP